MAFSSSGCSRQRWHQALEQLGRDLPGDPQAIGEPERHQLEVGPGVFDLHPERRLPLRLRRQGPAEQVAHQVQRVQRGVGLLVPHQRRHRIEAVEQKMRPQLSPEGAELRLGQLGAEQ